MISVKRHSQFPHNVTLYKSADGKQYILPQWIEVPADAEIADIQLEGSFKRSDTLKWNVVGSTGSKYTVSRLAGIWSCTCPRFQYHSNKFCKHIEQIRKKNPKACE